MRGNNTTDKGLDEHERLPCLGGVPEQPVLLHQQTEEELRRLGGLVDCQARITGLGKTDEALQVEVAERRRTEEQLRRVIRAHLALDHCNQAVIHATDEAALLQKICQTAVEAAGYRLCWVGYAEQDEAKTVRPMAQAGYEEDYLKTANITWADTERGQGPAGTAIRTQRPAIFQNALTAPRFAPWRIEASKRGYASVLGVPLQANSTVLGALTFYAS